MKSSAAQFNLYDTSQLQLGLRKAASGGYFEHVVKLTKKLPLTELNNQNSEGLTALHFACLGANRDNSQHQSDGLYLAIILHLLQSGIDPTIKNKQNKTASELSNEPLIIELCNDYNSFFKNAEFWNKFDYTFNTTKINQLKVKYLHQISHWRLSKNFQNLDLTNLREKKEISVVSLACGMPFEITVLNDLCNKLGIKMNYLGVDINQEVIDDNIKWFQGNENIKFLCTNATDLKNMPIANDSVDLIVLRHPDFTRRGFNTFKAISEKIIPSIIKSDGLMIASFYDQREMNYFLNPPINQYYQINNQQESNHCVYSSMGDMYIEPASTDEVPGMPMDRFLIQAKCILKPTVDYRLNMTEIVEGYHSQNVEGNQVIGCKMS